MSRRPEIELPKECRCPITLELMKNPVMAPDGITYERWAIEEWIKEHQTSPLTREPIPADSKLIPNRVLENMIEVLVTEITRRELAEDRLAQAESHLKNVLTDLSSDELATVPVTIEAVIDSFHGVGLFAPSPQLFDSEKLQELLQNIDSGDQDGKAEGMIKDNPELLKHATTITDHADRELNLTPFQLALFYRDWHMWQMIRQYMDPSDAAAQLQALEEHGTPYGTHYDFSDLKNAYQTYLGRYKKLVQAENWNELDRLWRETGKQQARAPLHVLQEFFRPDRSFEPTPKFDETERPLPRAIKLFTVRPFRGPRESIDGAILGVHFAFIRGTGRPGWMSWQSRYDLFVRPFAAIDSLAVAKLCETRSMQYKHLKAELLQAHAAPSIFLR